MNWPDAWRGMRSCKLPNGEHPWLRTVPLLNSEAGQAIVRESCAEHGFAESEFFDLLESEVEKVRGQRRDLFSDFDEIFDRRNGDVD